MWEALKHHHESKEVTIVQVDAHFDLRDDDSDFADEPHGKLAHRCVMRRAAEAGFNIVNVGVRAYSGEEMEFARTLIVAGRMLVLDRGGGGWLIHNPPCSPVCARSSSVEEICRAIQTDKVYLTLDVDGIDPAHMPATGTPVQGGLKWDYTQDLVQALFKNFQVIGADVVEVAVKDPSNMNHAERLTAYGAAQLIYDLIAYHGHCRRIVE